MAEVAIFCIQGVVYVGSFFIAFVLSLKLIAVIERRYGVFSKIIDWIMDE